MRIPLLLLILLTTGCAVPASTPFVSWLPNHTTVAAHRGGDHLGPENTIRAIQIAQQPDIDAEIVEIDLHTSADGEVVVIHDKTVDRVTGIGTGCGTAEDTASETFGTEKVHDMTVAELQALDAAACFEGLDGTNPFAGTGVVIPTLREVLEAFPSQRFMLEIKQKEPSIIEPLLAVVGELDAFDRSCFLAFDEQATQELAEAAPEACVSMPSSGIRCWSTENIFPFGGGGCPAYDVMWMPHENSGFDLKKQRLVDNVQAAGMPVFMWTINDQETMAAAAELGVEGIITDRPDLAREQLGTPGVGAPGEENDQ